MLRDHRFERFEVVPLTGALGAEVRGVELAPDADETTFAEVRRALDHYHVLAVRGQTFTPSAYHEVARRFGPFSGNPVHTPIEGYDDIVRFVREPDDTGMVAGENWHMDLAWMEKPPGITMLYGEVIPPVGGDTCFASLEHLYRALSPGMKALLAGLTGVHSGKGVFAINAATTNLGVRDDNARAVDELETEHPRDLRPSRDRPTLRLRQQRAHALQGHDRSREQADHRLPAGPRDAAGVHLPAALGAGHAHHVGQSVRAAHGDQRLFRLSPGDLPHDRRRSRAAAAAALEG